MQTKPRRRLNPKNRVHIDLAIEDKRQIVLDQIEMQKKRDRILQASLAMMDTPDDPERWEIPADLHYPTSKSWKKSGVYGLISSFLP